MTEVKKVEEEQTEKKGLVLFGVDVLKIECMRSSLLDGYFGAAVGGLGGFMYKSNVKFACHAAFGSYWVVAFSSWLVCRFRKFQKDKEWNAKEKAVNEARQPKDGYLLPRDLMVENEVAEEKSSEKS